MGAVYCGWAISEYENFINWVMGSFPFLCKHFGCRHYEVDRLSNFIMCLVSFALFYLLVQIYILNKWQLKAFEYISLFVLLFRLLKETAWTLMWI